MAFSLLNAASILAVLGAVHWYLWKRLVKDVSRKGGPWRHTGTLVAWLSLATAVGVMVSGPDGAPLGAVGVFAGPGYLWLAVLLYLVPALLLGELARPVLRWGLARRAARSPDELRGDPAEGRARDVAVSRRVFIARTVATGATVVGAIAYAYAEAMAPPTPSQGSGAGAHGVDVSLPFAGRWRVQNSPARRVPSHGTNRLGGRYAIDFVGVDDRNRTAGSRSWRTLFATEPPEIFFAFGRPILAPGNGTVVAVHDGEVDHEARRSQLALVPYAMGQARRLREGVGAIAGNYLIISLEGSGTFVALVHIQAGSIRVSVGQRVVGGEHIASCGNSGNSTQPHVHMQIMDSADLDVARGVPMLFRRFRERPSGTQEVQVRERAVPGEGAVVEPVPPTPSG